MRSISGKVNATFLQICSDYVKFQQKKIFQWTNTYLIRVLCIYTQIYPYLSAFDFPAMKETTNCQAEHVSVQLESNYKP